MTPLAIGLACVLVFAVLLFALTSHWIAKLSKLYKTLEARIKSAEHRSTQDGRAIDNLLEVAGMQAQLNHKIEERISWSDKRHESLRKQTVQLVEDVNKALVTAQSNDDKLLGAIRDLSERSEEHSLMLVPENRLGRA
jgi:hypothetical protein